jgi:hypothetical protein
VRLEAGQLALLAAPAQHGTPAARPRIARAGAVRVHLDDLVAVVT